MQIRSISAALLLLLALVASQAVTAAEPREMADAATVNRALHLYNVAICLDCPALIVTDLDELAKQATAGEKLKGPLPADAETIEILEAQEKAMLWTCRRIYALYTAGAVGGMAEYHTDSVRRLCLAKAQRAWAHGNAAATVDWLEQAYAWSRQRIECPLARFGDVYETTLDEWLEATAAMSIAAQNLYAIRQSCEALGYDLDHLGKLPALDEFDESWVRRNEQVASGNRSRTIPIVDMARVDAGSLQRYLCLLRVSECLGLPGTISPEKEHSADGRGNEKLDAETQQILEERLQWAIRSYRQVKRLSDLDKAGGDTHRRSSVARELCHAHAALAWAKGDLTATAEWLERTAHWATINSESANAAFDVNHVRYDLLLDTQRIDAKTRFTLLCVRKACHELGIDLKNSCSVSTPAVSVELNPTAKKNGVSPTSPEISALHRFIRSLNVASCLDVPPLTALADAQARATKNRLGSAPTDPALIDAALNRTVATTTTYRRVYALYVAGALGGEQEKRTRTATELCFARARLAWVNGQPNLAVAWLDQAVHWSEIAADVMASDYQKDCVTLDSYMAAQDMEAKAKLAARTVRDSCQALGHDLELGADAPSISQAASMPEFESYAERIRADYDLVDPWKIPPSAP